MQKVKRALVKLSSNEQKEIERDKNNFMNCQMQIEMEFLFVHCSVGNEIIISREVIIIL